MNTSKIIKGVVNGGMYTVTAPIMQEHYGIILKIEGAELPETYQVDFSNDEYHGTSVTMIGNADGVLIPRQFIDTGKDVFAFLYWVGKDYGKTVYKFRIPNKVRPDRTNEEPTPEEQSVIDQVIASLNDAVDRAEDAQQAIEDMSVSAETLAEGSTATVTKSEQDGVVHLAFGIPVGATGAQGERGLTGADGISPTVSITPITGGHRITITDADGEHSADVMDGTGNVDDVQINGSSIVVDGVANIPLPQTVTVTGTTPTITAQADTRYVCGEVATLDFTPSANGICDVVFISGSTPTVVTLPSTVKWANGFDPTALETNTTYELNIMDGLGVACAWT